MTINKNLIFSIVVSGVFIFLTPVDAYNPVTYTCCYNFSNYSGDILDGFEHINENSGSQLDNFENLNYWAIGTGTQYADTTNFKEGNQSLGLTSPNNNRVYSDKVINNNFANTNNFATWIYVYNASNFSYPRIYLTSTGAGWSKYYQCSYYSGMYNDWNKLLINGNSCYNYNNESWNNTINRIRVAMYPKTNVSTQVAMDDLRYNVNNEWLGGGTGATQEPDTVNIKEGSEGLKLTATNGYRAYSDKTINVDFTNINNFAVWLNVQNTNSFDFLRIYLTSTGDAWSKYYQCSIYSPGYKTGWNKLVFDKNWCTSFYNESWNNKMNKVRVSIYPRTGQNTSATLDDLRTNINGKRGKVIITFDDGDKNVSSKALPILSANNQSAVAFVVTSWIGRPEPDYSNIMNLSDIKNLQSSGWDISSHTIDHPSMIDIDNATLTIELNNSYNWLVNNSFQKSAGFMAYPYGWFDDNVIDHVKKRYVLARGISQQPITQHFDPSDDGSEYIQRGVYILNTTPVQALKLSIDDVINSKLLGIFIFHDIVDPDYVYGSNVIMDPYRYKTSDLKSMSDYLKSRSNDVDVVTYSDLVIPNIYSFTPVINKTTRIYSNGTSVLITKNKYDEYMPNMTVNPISDSIDIGITSYNETGGLIKFNESSLNSSLQVSYTIGDRIPNQLYSVKIYWTNGTEYENFNALANETGYINYNSAGFGDARYQEIDKTIAPNIIPLSIVDSSPSSDPTTTLGMSQTFGISLNKTANITWYINDSIIQTNSSMVANYTNSSANIGNYNVTVKASDDYSTVSRSWNWSVTTV